MEDTPAAIESACDTHDLDDRQCWCVPQLVCVFCGVADQKCLCPEDEVLIVHKYPA